MGSDALGEADEPEDALGEADAANSVGNDALGEADTLVVTMFDMFVSAKDFLPSLNFGPQRRPMLGARCEQHPPSRNLRKQQSCK